MAKLSLTVCDVDKDPSLDAKTYRITVDGKNYSADLCKEHSAPIREVMQIAEVAANGVARAPARKRAGFGTKVKTIEEIEAEKKAAKR